MEKKFGVIYDNETISKFKNNKEKSLFLDTNDKNIKILILGTKKSIYALVNRDFVSNIDYDEYVFNDLFDNIITHKNVDYKPVSVLSKEDYEDGIFKSSEHLGIETINKFRGKGINSEMFKIKDKIDGSSTKTAEKLVSNIYMLLKNGYKVIGKVDKKTGEIIPFFGQEFIEKIISIKIRKNDFDGRLSDSYIFEKK